MRYVFDTNALIVLANRRSEPLAERVLEADEGDIGMSAVVAHELYFGAYRSRRVAFNLETLRMLMSEFPVVPFDREDARSSGEIRAALSAAGQPVGAYDALIAGQARARRLTVITYNVREFSRVEGLKVEGLDEAGMTGASSEGR